MNQRGLSHVRLSAAICMVLCGTAFQALAKAEAAYSCRVIKVQGYVRCTGDGTNWVLLKRGDVIVPGSVVQTSEESSVDIVLLAEKQRPALPPDGLKPSKPDPERNVIRIFPSSAVTLEKAVWKRKWSWRTLSRSSGPKEIELDLSSGSLMGIVTRKPSAGSKYEVKFSSGLVQIHGGSYHIMTPDQLSILEGSATVSIRIKGENSVKELTALHKIDCTTGIITEFTLAPLNIQYESDL